MCEILHVVIHVLLIKPEINKLIHMRCCEIFNCVARQQFLNLSLELSRKQVLPVELHA